MCVLVLCLVVGVLSRRSKIDVNPADNASAGFSADKFEFTWSPVPDGADLSTSEVSAIPTMDPVHAGLEVKDSPVDESPPLPAGGENLIDEPVIVKLHGKSHAQFMDPTIQASPIGIGMPPYHIYPASGVPPINVVKQNIQLSSGLRFKPSPQEQEAARAMQLANYKELRTVLSSAVSAARTEINNTNNRNTSRPCPSLADADATSVNIAFPPHFGCPGCISSLAALTAFMKSDLNFANPQMAMYEFSSACSYVESDYIQICRYIYNVHGRHVVNMLFKDMVPAHVCTCINFCSQNLINNFLGAFQTKSNVTDAQVIITAPIPAP